MYLKGESNPERSVRVSVWSKRGATTKEGHKSHTFTVEDTSIDEMVNFIKKCVRNRGAK